ncbi:4544_t:CDS:1, partial [Acaulospora colombiana]
VSPIVLESKWTFLWALSIQRRSSLFISSANAQRKEMSYHVLMDIHTDHHSLRVITKIDQRAREWISSFFMNHQPMGTNQGRGPQQFLRAYVKDTHDISGGEKEYPLSIWVDPKRSSGLLRIYIFHII